MNRNLLNESISSISKLIKSKQLNCEELTRLCLTRADKIRSLNAFITICEQTAIEDAKFSDLRYSKAKNLHHLDGIPIAIKDNFCTKHIRTTCASKILNNYIPPFNATVVEKLKGKRMESLQSVNLLFF